MKWSIVTTSEDFVKATSGWQGPIACDTETYGKAWDADNRKLVGISLAPANKEEAVYVPVNQFEEGRWKQFTDDSIKCTLLSFFDSFELVGHNYTYDMRWLELEGFTTKWVADTRIMWHLSSAPAGPQSYGLKDAQKQILGWAHSNEKELELNVAARGGSLRNGDHYMADLDIIAKYACLDAFSTIAVFKKLQGFFDQHDYWSFLSRIMAYNQLLEKNTYLGVVVDVEGLKRAKESILEAILKHERKFRKELAPIIGDLETDWVDRKISAYKRQFNKDNYVNTPQKWKRLNLNSDKDKRELFYGKLQCPVTEKTESGLPSTSADVLRQYHKQIPALEEYLAYEKNNTLLSNFCEPYLNSVGTDNRLHPGFNICGTVSYRLSGFKPYLLNAPFDEKVIMKHLKVEEGWVGVHADLSAIEPTITAHYSEDPSLLKVFRDGKGDIYLDLALELFPNDKELQHGYNPNVPVTKEVKERFSKQRKVSKVIQLAVQYTGTGYTVSKNLTKDGIPTTVEQANGYVRAYWRKFKKVDEFNRRLREVNRKDGLMRNVIGRIIRVPDPNYKDLPNRFIQSGAHDVLVLWVLKIYECAASEGIEIRPILIDCHDSTSNQVRVGDVKRLLAIYESALTEINKELGLSVTIKAEAKTFSTLAGLKGDE